MTERNGSVATELGAVAELIDTAVSPVFEVLAEISGELLSAGDPLSLDSLTGVREVAQRAVAANAGWLAGTGYVAAVGALSEMPRWIEWWMAGPAAPRPLRVNLDPRLPDFYDYTSAEWFRLPRDSGSRSVDGPYVDVRGTNEYTVTVAVPVTRNDTFLGVAAADLYLSGLEKRLLPILHRVSNPVLLSNASGRVIVSTDSRLLPGQLLRSSDTRVTSTCQRFPWLVSATKAKTADGAAPSTRHSHRLGG